MAAGAPLDVANDRWGNCIGMTVEVFPTGVGLGAEIKGVDLSQPLEDAIFTEIETPPLPGTHCQKQCNTELPI